jgi:hypothetical protein
MTWSEDNESGKGIFEPEAFLVPPTEALLRKLFGARWGIILVSAPETIPLEPVLDFLADYSIQLAFYSGFSAESGDFSGLERERSSIKTLDELLQEAEKALPKDEENSEPVLEPVKNMPVVSHVPRNPEFIFVPELDSKVIPEAVQAALSGRLVIAGIRAGGSFPALKIFRELVGSKHLSAAILMGIIGLNAVGRICSACKAIVEYEMTNQDAFLLGVNDSKLRGCRGEGCARCDKTGMSGQMLIHEGFEVSENLRTGILQNVPLRRLRMEAKREGMRTLLDAVWSLAEDGETTLEEVMRIADDTDPGSDEEPGVTVF